MVLVVVASCHLGLLMLLLRPAISRQRSTPIVGNRSAALELRFIHATRPSPPRQRSPAHRPIAPAVRDNTTLTAKSLKPLATGQATYVDRPPPGARSPHEALLTSVPGPDAVEGPNRDGGFLERLHNAQRSYSIHGVPGSDAIYAPGIHLVDPMKQGIGAVMRTTQRAFGIKSSHCIDVDVWRHLTPQALSARHISPGDVDSADKKYRCNDPPGLHF